MFPCQTRLVTTKRKRDIIKMPKYEKVSIILLSTFVAALVCRAKGGEY
jgi:hypothetical protein